MTKSVATSLFPSEVSIGLSPVGEYLMHRDAEGPDVGGGGEVPPVHTLGGVPSEGPLAPLGGHVVLLALAHHAGQAEVTDLALQTNKRESMRQPKQF